MPKHSSNDIHHECEMKYKILDETEVLALKRRVEALGFVCESQGLETDFVPDVPGFLCRSHGLLIRFRSLEKEGHDPDVLVTLKIKGDAKTFQEYFELEYHFSAVNTTIFADINERLREATGLMLPEGIHSASSFMEIVTLVKRAGFSEHRILLQKKRQTYANREEIITFDFLPEGIGWYMEIEADTPEKLQARIKSLALSARNLTMMNYGDILKKYKESLPDQDRRIGLFTDERI